MKSISFPATSAEPVSWWAKIKWMFIISFREIRGDQRCFRGVPAQVLGIYVGHKGRRMKELARQALAEANLRTNRATEYFDEALKTIPQRTISLTSAQIIAEGIAKDVADFIEGRR